MSRLANNLGVFRSIDAQFGKFNVFKYEASKTISLGPVMVATVAGRDLPWLECEVISENNYRRRYWGPRDEFGYPDHYALQREKKADIIGISAAMTNAAPRALQIMQKYLRMPPELRPTGIIIGGWHACDYPDEFLNAAEENGTKVVVVHGEAETVISRLIESICRERTLEDIPGISYKENGIIIRNGPDFLIVPGQEIDYLPDPNFWLVRYAKIKIFPVQRTRGCSGKCRFCRVKTLPRAMSPERFLKQIKDLVSKGVKVIFIVDDRFEEDREGCIYLMKGLIEYKKQRKTRFPKLIIQTRLSAGKDDELLALMRQAGVVFTAIGYESPIREELLAMKKPVNPAKMVEWSRGFCQNGISKHMMMILGYPRMRVSNDPIIGYPDIEQPPIRKTAKKFWQFIRQVNPDTLQVLLYTPLPGTEDRFVLEGEGRIYEDVDWGFYDGTYLAFRPDKGIDPLELQHEFVNLMRKFYGFPIIWKSRLLTLCAHWLISIIPLTLSMPFHWIIRMPFMGFSPAKAWQYPRKIFRNAWKRFLGHLIIMVWMRNYKQSGFEDLLIRKSAEAKALCK